jgi:AmmeMemoRadiSam system protein A/AmmeMemoRadiSam system protein B
MQFDGASIYTSGDYITPLGHIKMDDLGIYLVKQYPVFTDDPAPHLNEHTIEVQLPFLQFILQRNFSIVPIVLGTSSPITCKEIARTLKPYFNSQNLFVISTDLCHYPPYEQARKIDSITTGAVLSNNPESFLTTLNEVESNKDIPNLLTAMCGWTSVLTLLDITSTINDLSINMVDYQNSGDIERGDKSRVVGYVALSIEKNNKASFYLTIGDQKNLLNIARESITGYLAKSIKPKLHQTSFSTNLKQSAGAFVTLTKQGKLRGCIGSMSTEKPLFKTVREVAISAAVNDSRFEPVSFKDLKDLKIEISVLTPMRKISSINEIIIGKHGIFIKKGMKKGTFLPHVPVEHNWTLDEFLGYCSRDKADLDWDGWKDAEIFVYEAIVFSE